MKTIDTLVQDVYKVMQTRNTKTNVKEIADTVGKEVAEAIEQAFGEPQPKNGLRMSGIGKCERAQWYSVKGYEQEEIEGQVYLTFLTGHIMEAVLLGIIEIAGHTVTGKQQKHEVEGVKGSQDCYIDGELVDVKTASDWSFNNKFDENGIKSDTFGYIKQLSGYGKTEGRDTGYFLAFNKNKSTLKLCKQELESDIDKHIIQLKEKMELDEPPMRIAKATTVGKDGRERLSMDCAFCGHKENCYGSICKETKGKFTSYFVDKVAGSF